MATEKPVRRNWTCRRCGGDGKLPTDKREPCPACGGSGQISKRRINSFIEGIK